MKPPTESQPGHSLPDTVGKCIGAGKPRDLRLQTIAAMIRSGWRWLVKRDRAPQRLWRISGMSAVAVALALASAASAIDPMHVRYYETSVGEHRTISCANASITLNTESRIAIQCARTLLRAHLLHGEALFRVASDPSKTVMVLAGDAQIVNFGTVFSVRHGEDQTTVTVVEGAVRLSALESILHGSSLLDGRGTRTPQPLRSVADMVVWAGQRGAIVKTGSKVVLGSQTLDRSQIMRALQWESGVLAFQDEPVAEVVEEVNRYNRTRIEIADPSIGLKRLSLIINATDLDGLMRALEPAGVEGVRIPGVIGSAGAIVLTYRAVPTF